MATAKDITDAIQAEYDATDPADEASPVRAVLARLLEVAGK